MKSASLLVLILSLAIKVFMLWAIVSIATSALKAGMKECDKTYGIEAHGIRGDWLCPI